MTDLSIGRLRAETGALGVKPGRKLSRADSRMVTRQERFKESIATVLKTDSKGNISTTDAADLIRKVYAAQEPPKNPDRIVEDIASGRNGTMTPLSLYLTLVSRVHRLIPVEEYLKEQDPGYNKRFIDLDAVMR
jgi:hypothetical protein